ncbi:MAG: RpiB/LacA/LacB family sugar-phosphate isomerase [Chloroflexi bacterium]|nr:RpiB/LacA/LacB family sugar-phosphate isomerase [Chloroflexota bacterium]
MKIAVGSDERTHLTDFVVDQLQAKGWEIQPYGPLAGETLAWPEVAEVVASTVTKGEANQGILFCWTGTGVAIAANKVPGIRAALCADAATAAGARRWDDANVLCLSLRLTSEAVAQEILEAWFSTPFAGGEETQNLAKITSLEQRYKGPKP